jgi:hypothetical protein
VAADLVVALGVSESAQQGVQYVAVVMRCITWSVFATTTLALLGSEVRTTNAVSGPYGPRPEQPPIFPSACLVHLHAPPQSSLILRSKVS